MAVGTQTGVAMISRGELSTFVAMSELRLTTILKMIASWLLFFHSVGIWLAGSGTKLGRGILSIRLFEQAPRERKRLCKNIILIFKSELSVAFD